MLPPKEGDTRPQEGRGVIVPMGFIGAVIITEVDQFNEVA